MYLDLYKGFIVACHERLLIIKDPDTGEEAHSFTESGDLSEAIDKAHWVIDQRIYEKSKEDPTREVAFALELSSGVRYQHSYLVPESVIKAGDKELERFLALEALGDKLSVVVEEVYGYDGNDDSR